MTAYHALMDQLTDKGALFNVSTDTLMTGSGTVVKNKKSIINNSTGEVIGIVSPKYKVVSNEEIFNSFCKSVENSDLNVEDAMVNVSFANGGSRTLVDFIFPNERVLVPGDTSDTALSITALNSFDGSTRYLTKAGGLRMKCLNGQLIGTVVGSYSSTHSPNLSVEKGAEQVVRMLKEFKGAEEYWGAMMKTKVTDQAAVNVIAQFFNRELHEEPIGSKEASNTFMLWQSYSKEFGANAYALYNALTDWVTHKQSKSGASARINRERQLHKTLQSPIFSQERILQAA